MGCDFVTVDTVYDVAERVSTAIEQNRRQEADNSSIKLARLLLNPLLANIVVTLARLLDRYGILPKYILDASPCHTSMYITNMASIGMPSLNYYIYNFGTTSQFISLGFVTREKNSKITMDIYAKAKYNKPRELASLVHEAFGQ